MARILFNGAWFEEVSPMSFYETDYENIIVHQSALIYPNFFIVPFKLSVYSDMGAAKADLALIDKKYRNWWVAEIEMSYHSLESHILPQVEILSNATYGKREAEHLHAQMTSLNLAALLDMMKGQQPRVIVVVNKPRPDWIKPLEKYGAILEVCEVFRSLENKYIFRLNGEHPPQHVEMVSECVFDNLIPRFLQVKSPSILPIKLKEKVAIVYESGTSEWERIDVQDKVWLVPIKANPLNPKNIYSLRLLEDGSLEIRRKK